jgi:1,4-dihydroxy-2-naphthoate octaprenyltransferase
MLCFGPLVAQFTAYVLGAEAFVTEFVPVLLPHLLLVEAWLMCCNGRDVAHDNKVKSYTLATSMGSEASMLTYALVLCLAFLAILQLVVFSSLWYAVILLSGPLGYPCLRGALKMDTQGLPGQTIRLHALVTGLTALGVVLADTFSFVEPPPPADSIF